MNVNPPSCFLDEIPERLLRREGARSRERAFSLPQRREKRETFPEMDAAPLRLPMQKKTPAADTLGKPRLRMPAMPPEKIPGVTRGFVPSAARQNEAGALRKLFAPGDRVRHPKFGMGTVLSLSGQGANARIRVGFDRAGERELALAIAPIVKVEEKT